MRVTLVEVARAAGVSVATTSRVLSRSPYPVSEETRRRVLEAAQTLGYEPNLLARSLRTDQSLTIGIIVENILSPFVSPIVRGIQEYLRPRHYIGIILNSDRDPEVEAWALRSLSTRRIDGVILVETYRRSSEEITELAAVPHVFIHRIFDSERAHSVMADDVYGARLAVRHLAQLGHRRIAFIGGLEGWDGSVKRRIGYQDELAANGITFDEQLVRAGDWGVQSGYDATRELLALTARPTAIFAANDLMALGAIYAAQEAGLRVPGDLAVVGYDDRDFAGYIRPAITTIRMPCEEMGCAGAEMLLNLIEGKTSVTGPIRIRGELRVRESCGAGNRQWRFEPERASLTRKISSGGG